MRVIVLVVLRPLAPYPRRESTDRNGTRHDQWHPVAEEGVVGRIPAGSSRWWSIVSAGARSIGGGALIAVIVGHYCDANPSLWGGE
jgi:hypothetical protein